MSISYPLSRGPWRSVDKRMAALVSEAQHLVLGEHWQVTTRGFIHHLYASLCRINCKSITQTLLSINLKDNIDRLGNMSRVH